MLVRGIIQLIQPVAWGISVFVCLISSSIATVIASITLLQTDIYCFFISLHVFFKMGSALISDDIPCFFYFFFSLLFFCFVDP